MGRTFNKEQRWEHRKNRYKDFRQQRQNKRRVKDENEEEIEEIVGEQLIPPEWKNKFKNYKDSYGLHD